MARTGLWEGWYQLDQLPRVGDALLAAYPHTPGIPWPGLEGQRWPSG